MKVLHIAPHLGGGIGKALEAISAALPKDVVEQTFLLLEAPINKRHVAGLTVQGYDVVVAEGLQHIEKLAGLADIVQFEFINHPKMFECLACVDYPPMRNIIWAHISGLFRPFFQPGLIEQAQRFVFSSEVSYRSPVLDSINPKAYTKISDINSGFGFITSFEKSDRKGQVKIGYLGTVNFSKMSRFFFDAIDLMPGDFEIDIWGAADQTVIDYANTKKHSERFKFHGETPYPEKAMAEIDIFFYPLQPQHYGTGENSLIEAMSVGIPVVVLDNPAERKIVTDGETGFIVSSEYECSLLLSKLLKSPILRRQVGLNAIRKIEATKTPRHSAIDFLTLWHNLLDEAPTRPDFRSVLGNTPAAWFLSTQELPNFKWHITDQQDSSHKSKGTLAHFEKVFAGDVSFSQLV